VTIYLLLFSIYIYGACGALRSDIHFAEEKECYDLKKLLWSFSNHK